MGIIWLFFARDFFILIASAQKPHINIRALAYPAGLYEPRHEISNNAVCATSKAYDQPAHTRSLIRAFASGLNIL